MSGEAANLRGTGPRRPKRSGRRRPPPRDSQGLRSLTAKARASLEEPRPGPISSTSIFFSLAKAATCAAAFTEKAPPAEAAPKVIASGRAQAMIFLSLSGQATVTSPAPALSAARAARTAAPVSPREPATTSTRP